MRAPVIVPEMLVGVSVCVCVWGRMGAVKAQIEGTEGSGSVHLRVLLGVHHGSDGDTEVGDRAPEV